ncbi:PPOX class probable F420-dependent enzyme [Nocardiopsis sp. Huas11]|uniref:TIGR03668 family PPOX class F420-dependent oxidoreductase n=1 Tax=Nocardiopsis sp. Huas11 TaxID=2183912 RepID=UPI000F2C6C2D|nr:TIGR03668 family PPOX class F420-dependent oxidoreductase [Nocardiopsis sp. Huas11]RKS06558.1 PPOX class probable F420-dependent enzyme [Nocardiopsis sp. Huas11]
MKWSSDRAREAFTSSRIARLATADSQGAPHLVPVTYAAYGDTVAIAVDSKPKSTHNLKRIRNIDENPRVSLLADEYDDDWTRLWWARADGSARVEHEGAAWFEARERLMERYVQYRESPPDAAIILINVHRWSGWSFR